MKMVDDKTFYTTTMARVYTHQGRYEAAAQIYRYLLEQTPERADLRVALAEVTAMLPASPAQWTAVSDLIERWVRIMLRARELQRLQRIRVAPIDGATSGRTAGGV
jgi:hypothetical protein